MGRMETKLMLLNTLPLLTFRIAFTGKTSSFVVAAITHASPTWWIFLQICALYAHVEILTEKPFQTVLQAQ